MTSKRKPIIAVGVLAFAGAGTAGALSTAGSPQANKPFEAAVLSKPKVSAAEMPAKTRAFVRDFAEAAGQAKKIAPNSAKRLAAGQADVRRVDHPTAGRVFVITTGDSTCLTEGDKRASSGLNCLAGSQPGVGNPPISVTQTGESQWQITALLPDGVKNVVVSSDDGSRAAVIAENIAQTVVDSPPTGLNWTDADGVEHQRPFTGLNG